MTPADSSTTRRLDDSTTAPFQPSRRLLPLLLFLAMAAAAFGAIRSYDLFWQLATGRWIVEQRALPLTDPFALASERSEWIDGEWLYEVALYAAHEAAGLRGLSIARGLLAALIFTLAFLITRRESEPAAALLSSAAAFAGAMAVLDLRPSGVAALLVVVMLGCRSHVTRGLVTLLWINVHPSALLAPLLASLRAGRAESPEGKGRLPAMITSLVVCALALLCNPHGWKAIVAPIELTAFVRGGGFVNAEWLPSLPARFPLLYIGIVVAVVAYAMESKRDWTRIALLALFAFLAVRHVRNQPLFFAAFPILVAPSLRLTRLRPAIAWAASAAAVLLVAVTGDHRLGVAPERFPVAAVERLRATRLPGAIYNADQFGGYLIWQFYPERRVLTDGRNELYRSFIPEWQAARGDQRRWAALLRRYRIDLAVEEYRPPLNVVDGRSGKPVRMDASLAYWPRAEWALIARDDAAMVFARRKAFPGVERWEMPRESAALSSPVRADP